MITEQEAFNKASGNELTGLTLAEVVLMQKVLEDELDRRSDVNPCKVCENCDPADGYPRCENCLGTQINGYHDAMKQLAKAFKE